MQNTAALPLPIGHAHKQAPVAQPDLYLLGVNYMMGRGGVAADLGMAAASFLDAADANDPRGLYAAGMMYLKGIGVSVNPETAMTYLQKSAGTGHAPSRKVLDALAQGKDVSAYPIVAQESVSSHESSAISPSGNRVTPKKILAIVAAAIVVVAGAGTGIYMWSEAQSIKRREAAAEVLRVSEAQRIAANNVASAQEAERSRLTLEAQAANQKAAAAVQEADAARKKMSDAELELAAKAEALRQREKALQSTTAARAPETAPSAAVAGAVATDWNAMLKQSEPYLRTMLEGANANNSDAVVKGGAAIRAMPQPARGERKVARARNTEALEALKANDPARAASILAVAVAADGADEEIATNLGYALVKQGRAVDAQTALQRALYLNPTRSSAWYNLGLSFLAQGKEPLAYSAFLITYQFAGSQQKSRDWFEKVSQDPADPALQRLAKRIIVSPMVVANTPNATPAAPDRN